MDSIKFIQKYFKKCKDIAKQSTFRKCHTGCVVVYKNKIISTGYNMSKTHPLQKKYNKERFSADCSPHYMHAEISALSSLINVSDIDWSKIRIFVLRLNGLDNNKVMYAKPCSSCMKIIQVLGIRHIYYTTNNGYCYQYLNGNDKTVNEIII